MRYQNPKFLKKTKNASPASGTKKALIASALCTVLCVMLLLSTTIAWFTATKESNQNELYSGNLDIRLYYAKTLGQNTENPWTEINSTTSDIFKVKGTDEETEHDMLWEPGATNVVYFKIENKGSLSAKYDFFVEIQDEVSGKNLNDEDFKLSDYIQAGVAELAADSTGYTDAASARAAITTSEKKLSELCESAILSGELNGIPADNQGAEKQEKIFALVLYMPENSGDTTNYKTPENGAERPKVPLRIKLVATQKTGENDSFGSKYDENIMLSEKNLRDAFKNPGSGSVIRIGSSIELTEKLNINGEVTVLGNGSAAITKYPTYIGADSKVTFKDVKFNGTTALVDATSVYAQNFKGTLIFDGCTFGASNWESVQITPAGNCTIVFKNCTFNGAESMKRFIHIEPAKSNEFKLDVTVTGCTFNNCDKVKYNADENNKGSVIDFDYFAKGSTITMGKNTFNRSVESYELHPYFCTASVGESPAIKEVTGSALLGYLTGDIKTYTVDPSSDPVLKSAAN